MLSCILLSEGAKVAVAPVFAPGFGSPDHKLVDCALPPFHYLAYVLTLSSRSTGRMARVSDLTGPAQEKGACDS